LIIGEVKAPWESKLKSGDRVIAVNGDEKARYASRFISHARGEQKLTVAILRDGKKETVDLTLPEERDVVRRKGVYVSGMVVSRSTQTEYDPSIMWVQFVDDASIADQSMINEGDQLVTVNGKAVKNHEDVLNAFKNASGKEIELIIRRPKFTLISGRYDYLVRKIDVEDVREVGSFDLR
jgi:C-terminal processing protease CtpA/Prc